MARRGPFLVAATLAVGVLLTAPAAAAAEDETDHPVLVTAEELIHDEKTLTTTARGKVELVHGARILLADKVIYDQRADSVVATGDVALLEPGGDILTADYVELSNQLKTGFIKNLHAFLADGSRVAARRVTRDAGQSKVMDQGVFTPCKPCEEDAEAPPLWQIKALRVIHDEQARDMIYREAWLEFWGQPVVYLPFFFHPDPTVERRSGWLTPRFGQSEQVGAILSAPYYWSISPDRDLEVEPIFYSKSGGILRTRYRQHLGHGEIDLAGSIGRLDDVKNGAETGGSSWQGNIDLQGRFALDPTWRAGFDVEHVSKRTYLRLYRLSNVSTLTSRAFAEGFRGQNYAQISAYRLQGLQADDIGEDHPVIAPWGEYDFVGLPDKLGGHAFANASTVALHRDRGVDSKRLSFDLGYHLPHTTAGGHVLAATAKLSSDIYHVNNFTNPSGNLIDDDVITRVFPQLGVEWRYPLVRRGANYTQLIEPRAMLVTAPDSGNSDDIPNEDSLNFAFDDTALFRLNRFNGRDRLSGGTHVDYGVNLAVHGDGGGETRFSIGQALRLSGDQTFTGESRLSGRVSDYVGHLIVAPTDTVDVHYRFRLDRDDLSAHRSELAFRYRKDRFRLGLDHVKVSAGSQGTGLRNREQIGLSLGADVSRYWQANFGIIHDFSDGENDTRDLRMSLRYEDECFAFAVRLEHSDTRDEDIEPDTALFFSINLKYLGDFAVNRGG